MSCSTISSRLHTINRHQSFCIEGACPLSFFFFFNDTATTEIYTLSLHDALPISPRGRNRARGCSPARRHRAGPRPGTRSEEHTSELQSRLHLVCRLLLEKKKTKKNKHAQCQSANVLRDFARQAIG